jgi:hypothetical protein
MLRGAWSMLNHMQHELQAASALHFALFMMHAAHIA